MPFAHILSALDLPRLGALAGAIHACAHEAAFVYCTTGDMAAAVSHGFGAPLLRALRG